VTADGEDPAMQSDVRVRRVYDPPEPQDSTRVLVDRLWPRGLSRDAARLDEWAKDVAPSSDLRSWYGHDPAKFAEFCRRYTEELAQGAPRAALDHLATLAAGGPVTLLTATRDISHSQAAVLAQLLRHQATGESAEGGQATAEPGKPGEPGEPGEGGEAACWAHLVCPECGAITTEGHRPECASA
jgi:uncharacterized protein YeaO (DUF488 family)